MVYAIQIDLPDGLVNRQEVFDAVDKRLATPLQQLVDEAVLEAVKAGRLKPDRATWGRSPQAVAGQRAMMRGTGGPAPMRPPKPEPAKDPAP